MFIIKKSLKLSLFLFNLFLFSQVIANLRPIEIAKIVSLGKVEKYYKNRKNYTEEAISIIRKFIIGGGCELNNVLELGPYKQPIVENSDVMDLRRHIKGIKYVWDATKTPWPLGDKSYDLFIALQVWEHLGDKQKEAFAEVVRMSKMAILSFPYKWKCKKDNCHYGIDDSVISDWTLGFKPAYSKVVREDGDIKERSLRKVCFFIFD
ncbi:hypothetical protein HN511_04095 [bacterium]|jgi:hypothetical protein|nr:hypothetical protein [bacterium]